MMESFANFLHRVFIADNSEDLSKLTRKQLELKGREIGIELDRRYKKKTLVEILEKAMRAPNG